MPSTKPAKSAKAATAKAGKATAAKAAKSSAAKKAAKPSAAKAAKSVKTSARNPTATPPGTAASQGQWVSPEQYSKFYSAAWGKVQKTLTEIKGRIPARFSVAALDEGINTAATELRFWEQFKTPQPKSGLCRDAQGLPFNVNYLCQRTTQQATYVVSLLNGYCTYLHDQIPGEVKVTEAEVGEFCKQVEAAAQDGFLKAPVRTLTTKRNGS